jgi:hypothetical protein
MAILVQCPVCTETLEAPQSAAGKGCACPVCHAVVSVPLADPEPRLRTFAVEVQAPPSHTLPPPLPMSPSTTSSLPLSEGRVCPCPTCGKTLTITPDLEGDYVTCPFCEREFRTDGQLSERPKRRSRRRRHRFECPYCGSHEEPIDTKRVSSAGWVLFTIFLLFLWPLFWIGLLITERETRCYDCRRRLYC